jgi:uncharacterized NAD-dependent epimerase/dehydratase family protein
MRQAQVVFTCQHPNRRYRHEKPDIKNLLEKKDETYVDVSSAAWAAIWGHVFLSRSFGVW